MAAAHGMATTRKRDKIMKMAFPIRLPIFYRKSVMSPPEQKGQGTFFVSGSQFSQPSKPQHTGHQTSRWLVQKPQKLRP